MNETEITARVVLTTASNPDEARRLARTLVEERLAACATLIPAVESIYRWQGAIETSAESLLLIKTTSDRIDALQARILALHTYETPEFLVLPVVAGSHAYLAWLYGCLNQA